MGVRGEALAFLGAYEGVEIVKFLDPRGASSQPQEKYDLSADIRLNDGAGISVSLLANGFPDSQLFLEKVSAALKARLPNIQTRLWNKHNAGVAASDEMLDEMLAAGDVAIAAYGH